MERWSRSESLGKMLENLKVDAFLAEVTAICEKHNMSISHEDTHGAFIVQPFDESNIKWLMGAVDDTQSCG